MFACGLILLSCALAYYQQLNNARTLAQASSKAAQHAADQMVETMRRYQYGLRGARGAVLSLGEANLSRQSFYNYSLTRDIGQEFPGARGFGFIRRVAPEQLTSFVASARTDGKADFAIRQLQRHDGDRYVIQYVEPAAPNLPAIGLDIASEENRRNAAVAAMRSGEVRLTGPITLVQALGRPSQSFLIMMPVYRSYTTPADAVAREAALIGWTYAPLVTQDVLVAANLGGGGGVITLDDITEHLPGQRFFRSNQSDLPAGAAVSVERTVYGRRWQLRFEPLPRFVESLGMTRPLRVLAVSLMLSMISTVAFGLLLAYIRGRRRLIGEQARLATIVESSLDGIIGMDLNGTVQSWNSGAERLFGYSAQDAIGQKLARLIGPLELEHDERDILARIAEGAEIGNFQTTRRHRDGQLLQVSVSVASIRDASGRIIGASKTVRDISELMTAQRHIEELNANLELQVAQRTVELSDTRKTLRTVLDAVPSMIGYWDAGLINRVANHAYHKWFGVDAETIPGMHLRALLGDAIFQANLPHIEAVLRGEPQIFERAIPDADGAIRHALTNYLPDRVDGVVCGFYVVVHDVTELVLSRQELGSANLLLQSVLLASSEIAIIATDLDGLITVFNRGAELMLGYTSVEMVGLRDPGCLHLPDEVIARGREMSEASGSLVEGFRVFFHVPEQLGAERREWTYVRRDGAQIPVELVVTAMRDAQGVLTGYLGMANDISQRRTFEAGLIEARQIAERASAAKGQFLANMSHEIRTPMNAVLGMLQLVRKTELSARQRDYIEKSYSAGQSLLAILNDILDYSKIDAGKMAIECISFDIEFLLRDLGVVMAGNHLGKPVEVLFDLPPTLPRWVSGDRLRLQQVLINLAGNALKFTERGEVVLAVEERNRAPDELTLRFSVRDSGIGMQPDQLQMIFDGFSQAESSTSRRFGGTGLGLAISRRLLTLMGAQLQVESTLGVGSCFWFDLSLGIATAPPMARPLEPLAQAHLLLVDDNPVAREILLNMIASLGWTVDLVIDGEQALAHASQNDYDAILMDWQLPGIDGLQTAKLLVNANPKQSAPVIMVSAYGAEVLNQALQEPDAPFCDYLTKPITPEQLREAVIRAIGGVDTGDKIARLPESNEQPLLGLQLLVVEDNALNREVIFELLQQEGAQVLVADGGLQGVSMVLGGEPRFDAVIMDMQMPEIDGLEASRRIRADGRFAELPILAISANVTAADQSLCLQAGMNDHLGKPINIDAVVGKLLLLCGRAVRPPSEASSLPNAEAADIESMRSVLLRFGGNVRVYANALAGFDSEMKRLCSELRQHIMNADQPAMLASLHTLKGLAATLGAKAVASYATELEESMRCETGTQLQLQDSEHLRSLSALSAQHLQQALAPFLPETATSPVRIEEAEWHRLLAETLTLLRAADMQALEYAQQLLTAAPPRHQTSLETMLHLTQQLDFAMAADLLGSISAIEQQ
jgi:PAS domain S-box-containing protein